MLATPEAPRYVQIAGELIAAISSGRLAIGDEVPTEWELSQTYGVSRTTAREALRRLQQEGLIARKRGAPGRVIASQSGVRYAVALTSEQDVLRYAGTTILQLQPHKQPAAAKKLLRIGLTTDEPWYSASGVRWSDAASPPIAATTVYVPARFASAVAGLQGPISGALFARIATEFGLTLASIEQTITASILTPTLAATLAAEAGEPALEIVRRFVAETVGVFEVSVSIHPASRFAYTVRFDRSGSTPKRDRRSLGQPPDA